MFGRKPQATFMIGMACGVAYCMHSLFAQKTPPKLPKIAPVAFNLLDAPKIKPGSSSRE